MSVSTKVFLDTNLLIYAHTDLDLSKQVIVQQIITRENSFVSTQVLKETANVLYKKLRLNWNSIRIVLNEIQFNNQIHVNTHITINSACEIAERYRFSFYDSLIIAAALESNCFILYSEDMHNGQIINGMTIKNPFA